MKILVFELSNPKPKVYTLSGTDGNLLSLNASNDIVDSGLKLNDSGTTTTDLFSASETISRLSTKQDNLGFTPENTANKNQANGYAGLDASGLINSSQLPAIAISKPNQVASEAEQLLLVAQEGDIAIRSDENKSYVHNGGSAGTMADWNLLLTPTGAVLSVDGQTGAVDLTTKYLQLTGGTLTGNLENTTQTFSATFGDKVSFYETSRLGNSNMGGIGVESGCLYFKTFNTSSFYRWYFGVNADGGVSDTMELSSTMLTMNGDINATGNLQEAGVSLASKYLALSGGTLTGTTNSQTILPTTTQIYNLGSSSFAYNDVWTKNLKLIQTNGLGIRFWNGNSAYSIYMSSQGDATWGGRLDTASDYNIYMTNSGGTARGFVFKNTSLTNNKTFAHITENGLFLRNIDSATSGTGRLHTDKNGELFSSGLALRTFPFKNSGTVKHTFVVSDNTTDTGWKRVARFVQHSTSYSAVNFIFKVAYSSSNFGHENIRDYEGYGYCRFYGAPASVLDIAEINLPSGMPDCVRLQRISQNVFELHVRAVAFYNSYGIEIIASGYAYNFVEFYDGDTPSIGDLTNVTVNTLSSGGGGFVDATTQKIAEAESSKISSITYNTDGSVNVVTYNFNPGGGNVSVTYAYSSGKISSATWKEGGTVLRTDTYNYTNGKLTSIS